MNPTLTPDILTLANLTRTAFTTEAARLTRPTPNPDTLPNPEPALALITAYAKLHRLHTELTTNTATETGTQLALKLTNRLIDITLTTQTNPNPTHLYHLLTIWNETADRHPTLFPQGDPE